MSHEGPMTAKERTFLHAQARWIAARVDENEYRKMDPVRTATARAVLEEAAASPPEEKICLHNVPYSERCTECDDIDLHLNVRVPAETLAPSVERLLVDYIGHEKSHVDPKTVRLVLHKYREERAEYVATVQRVEQWAHRAGVAEGRVLAVRSLIERYAATRSFLPEWVNEALRILREIP